MYNHQRAPIYEALLKIKENHVSFHVPGHKLGQDYDPDGLLLYQSILTIDQTEIDGLDDLHHAEGIIAEAEELAADAFGSEETKFLVGGTTAGIIALILATVGQGGKCLIQRNSHKSIFNGIKLVGGTAVLLNPNVDVESGVPLGVNPAQIEEELQKDPHIKVVFLTSPNYYGQTSDIKAIAEIVHRYGLPLLIDEAHGAHFKFHPDMPRTALSQGADGVVQSIHKTLPAMTMSSMIHFQGHRINRDRVKQFLSMIQSSSPSYPLMASLDLARRYMMVGEGRIHLDRAVKEVKNLHQAVESVPWIKLVRTDDPLRIVMLLPDGWSRLFHKHLLKNRIYVEIIEPGRIVLVVTGGNRTDEIDQLIRAIHSFPLPSESFTFSRPFFLPARSPSKTNVTFDWQLEKLDSEWIPLEESKGRIVAEIISPYPPGIPLLIEGEKVTEEMISILENLLNEGVHIQGMNNGRIRVYSIPEKGGWKS